MGSLSFPGTNRIVEFTDTGGSFAPAVFGDGWDKWGLTLTPAIVNDPLFGVFSVRTTVNSGTEKADLTQMEIFYTPAGAPRIDVGRGAVYVQVPSSYDSGTPTPLVLLLHGYGSSGAGQENYMDFGSLVDEFGFLYLHPDGRNESGGEFKRFWSGSSPCCNFYGAPDDDTAYLMDLIDEMKSQYNVDSQRVYLIGHSNGGFMSYRMACAHSDTIAAIATLAGATFLDPNDCLPTEAVNILQIHGTSDGTILYNGGFTFPGSSGEYPGAVETVEQWAAKNGCELVPDTSAPNIDLDGSQAGDETTVTRYLSSCDPSGQVELWTIVNGSHIPFPLSATFSRQVVEFLFAHPKAAPAPEGLPASRWGPIPLAVCLMLLGVGVIIRQRLRTRRE